MQKAIYDAKKLVRKKEGEVLATKGQLVAPFMLIDGTIRIGADYIRTRPGVFGTECFFNLESFNDIIAVTACTVLQLSPKCNSVSSCKHRVSSVDLTQLYFSFICDQIYLKNLFAMFPFIQLQYIIRK